MKCPQCRFEIPDDSKFCLECGTKIETACPQCSKKLPPGAKFCNECGHNLSEAAGKPPVKELTTEEKLDKIQKYLPPQVAEKILAQRGQIEGERKLVTVMFCDMKGYTSLSEKLDPEDVYSIMDQVYEILIRQVHDYEGTVNELTGDGIMALFGAPIALEDAPQRAIRSALAIHHKMARFSDKLRKENPGAPPLKMRVGIHTGPVVVGTLGNDLRVEFKAVGDTVNLASRMETMAEPGTTFVTEDTFKVTEGYFRFEGLGAQSIKGKEKPVNVFRVIAPSTRRTRFDVSTERGLTLFVGRERELEIMLDCLERAKMGRGQAISIVAEAGIGKSRLLYEFRKNIANEDVTFFEGRCLSYSRNVPFYPIIDLLKSVFGLEEGDSDDDIKEKLKKGLHALSADEASTLPYLLEVLSVRDTGLNPMMMSPEAKKDRISGALKQVVLKGASQRPLILAIEDLYWIDNSSIDVLKDLIDDIGGSAVFLIFTYRPTSIIVWAAKSYHSQITLNRLSNRESLTMAASLLGTDRIQSDLEELILEKTEGVPFYIEEFIRSLKHLKSIHTTDGEYRIVKDVHELSIPSTIQDVIMARVDALPEGAKEVLRSGSAIEREFSYDMIQKVTGLSEKELLSSLSVLKDAELLFERGIYPDNSFIFKHALTRDVVYNSLLKKRKMKLHEDIGRIIEDAYKERLSEYYEILVEHFTRSENHEKGADYAKLAERKALKTGLLADAISYAKKRIDCLEKLPNDANLHKKLISARTLLGLYYSQLLHPIEAKAAVDPIVELAINQNYKKTVPQIYFILGTYYFVVDEDYPKAIRFLEKALEIGKELNDIVSLVLVNNIMGCCLSDYGKFAEGFSCYEKALEINTMSNSLWGIVAIKANTAVWTYFRKGNVESTYRTSLEALKISDESGDIYSKAHANLAIGCFYYLKGCFNEAEQYLLNSVRFCARITLVLYEAIADTFLNWIYSGRREFGKSQEWSERAIALFQLSSVQPSWVILNKISISLARIMNQEKHVNINEVYELHNEVRNRWARGIIENYIAKILLNIDDPHISESEAWIKKAIETNEKYGMMWNLAQDYALYAEWYKRKGELIKAKESLNKAIDIFKECGSQGWVEKYEKEFSLLS